MAAHKAFRIDEQSQTGEARRAATSLADRIGFGPEDAGRAAIIVAELAGNLIAHAGGGEILLARIGDAVEIVSLDKGPGMSDARRCFEDGYSTAGTPGNGLGAVSRLADSFDVHSARGVGTAILARLSRDRKSRDTGRELFETGVVRVAVAGEVMCGDDVFVEERAGRGLFMIADGVGHGPLAAEAAGRAVSSIPPNGGLGPAAALEGAHRVLRSTRGAAGAFAAVDPVAKTLVYCGVGNISGAIVAPGASRLMVSHNGTLGYEARRFQEFSYPWDSGSLLVMHSDGLQTQWSLDKYPGLAIRHPSLVAAVLYRDFTRVRDDVTVLVARQAQSGPV